VTTPASESNPASPTVRRAVKADLLAIYRIEKASFPQPWPFAAFERYIGEPGFLVAELGPGIAGYVVADSVPNHRRPLGHIKDIAVHPDQQGQGIGTLLLKRSIAVLAAQGVSSVKLEVRESNEEARSLYETFNFEHARTIPRYYDNGEDALVMLADIDSDN